MGAEGIALAVRNMDGRRRRVYAARLLRGFLARHYFDLQGYVLAGPRLRIEKRFGRIELGSFVGFGADVGIAVIGRSPSEPAILKIGDHTHIQDRTHINCYEHVSIGSQCAISWDVEILDTNIHAVVNAGGEVLSRSAPVAIEDRVWIGARAIVLKGVHVGHDSVIAAGSVVIHDVPPCSLVGGNPARVIREIQGWQR